MSDTKTETQPDPKAAKAPAPAPTPVTQFPSVGRIVHLQHNGQTVAAIVTCVHTDTVVDLTAFLPGAAGFPFMRVPAGETDGCWRWPAR